MKYLFVFFYLFNFTFCQVPPFIEDCRTDAYPPPKRSKVPSYTINLDLPPKIRWSHLAQEKAEEIKTAINVVKNFTSAFFKGYLFEIVDNKFGEFTKWFPSSYGDELKGISDAVKVPLGEIVLFNIFYEFSPFCTSIIAENTQGEIFHARNLDFGIIMGWDIQNHTWLLTEALSKAVVNVNFQKQNQTLFHAVTFAGYIGVLSALKPYKFSFTMNTRFGIGDHLIGILKWLFKDPSLSFVSFFSRTLLENASDYETALIILQKVKLVAPAYFILGGNSSGQGCIITRDRESVVDKWCLNQSNDTWFLLETNYDHWKQPLFIDDRRDYAKKCLNRFGQKNMSLPVLFNVLSTKPVLNKLTTYSVLMQVQTGHIETYTQDCPDPCWPF